MSAASRAREDARKPAPVQECSCGKQRHQHDRLTTCDELAERRRIDQATRPLIAIAIRKGQIIQRCTQAEVDAQQMLAKYKLPEATK